MFKLKKVVILFFAIVSIGVLSIGCVNQDDSKKLKPENAVIEQQDEKAVIKEFDDLRQMMLDRKGISLNDMDLRGYSSILLKTTFDTHTIWPKDELLPKDFDPNKILNIGMNQGLGLKDLHKQGITGKGVRVAIIDQPLLEGHIEYKDRIENYTKIDCENVDAQMHGPAVASILVGKNCGVAPEASLHFWAEPSWKQDYIQRITALDQIIEYNKDKDLKDRIRVVSISIGYNDFPNLDKWKEKIKEAEDSGITVVHCSNEGDKAYYGVGSDLGKDRNDPSSYEICYFARNFKSQESEQYIYVPIDNVTTADFLSKDGYTFWASGGLSWGAPYLSGVIALGYQEDPNISTENIYKYIRETGTSFNGGVIINPKEFINKIRESK